MLQSSLNPVLCFHIYFLKKDRHNTFSSLFSLNKNSSSAVSMKMTLLVVNTLILEKHSTLQSQHTDLKIKNPSVPELKVK